MKKKFLRIMSGFLSAVMIALLIPFSAISVLAVDTITDVNEMGKLGSTYNMLGNQYIGTADMRRVFDDVSAITVQFDGSKAESKANYTYITSISEYFQNESSSMKVGFGTGSEVSMKLTVKMVELNLTQKNMLNISSGRDESSSSSKKETEEYMLFECYRKIGTYTMWLDNDAQIARLWQTDANGKNAFNSDFVKSLLEDDPAVFFANYGTHLITRYNAGGSSGMSYYGNINYESSNTVVNKTVSSEKGMEGLITMKTNVDHMKSEGEGESSEDGFQAGESYSTAGSGFAWDMESANSWASTVDKTNAGVLVDDTLSMIPIWTLLYQDEQTDRRVELEQYFNENVDSQYAELYGDYIYNPVGARDYSGYTQVRTAEDLANIANDLDGKYVLINNIDLGDAEWAPIGTEEYPFNGILDGNGNTVSGLNITKTTDGLAGLVGYNTGTIKNLTVSGNIDADATGSENGVAYIGGIAGYNAGTISQCYNNVNVNGKITITDDETGSTLVNETWFDTNKEQIGAAKGAETVTLTDGYAPTLTADDTVLKLTGTASNVSINIPGSTQPMYIVLEDADITGVITNMSDNAREVCIISIGEANNIRGANDTTPINIPNASLNIYGDATLNIYGGNGSNGTNGSNGSKGSTGSGGLNQVRGGTGGNGTNGSAGEKAKDGAIALISASINVDGDVNIYGGNGGTGGKGGTGGTGGTGGKSNAGVIGSAGAGNGGTGGTGGAGGAGGDGAAPVNNDVTINLYSGVLKLYNGNGGTGGNAGNGGKGGKGGYSYQWGAYCGWGGGGGSGGYGNNGGNGGNAAKYQLTDKISVCGNDSLVFIVLGNAGNGGNGSHGGAVGSPGGSDLDRPHFDNGTDRTAIYADNGNVEQIDYSVYDVVTIANSTKKYSLYYGAQTYNGISLKENEKLISIGSEKEQELVNELLSKANGESYWIGLERRANSGEGFDKFDWVDGSSMQIAGTGSDITANRINESNEVVCEAYTNFADGQPDNGAGVGEKYIYISADGKWCDGADTLTMGYITEKNLGSASTNTIDKNAIFVGGIAGNNDGNINSSYNKGEVLVDKAVAENSGVSSYVGGIAGYNNGEIDKVVNEGAVEGFAQSNSMSSFADAYAEGIATLSESGKATNYNSKTTASATAISANGLSDENANECTNGLNGEDATTDINKYWANSQLAINAVDKTEYLTNDGFDKSSLEMSLNGTRVTAYDVRYNFYEVGTSTVTVIYEKNGNTFTRYIPVTVSDAVAEGIEINTLPKVEFVKGDEFTYQGLSVKLNYSNGTHKLIPSKDVTVSVPNMNIVGQQTITVSYTLEDGVTCFTDTYTINISSVKVTEIQIAHAPEKLVYWQGESLDVNGMVIEKVMNNGTTEPISINNASLRFEYDFSAAGNQTVTVWYDSFSASFDCTVKEVEVVGIEVIQAPYKTTYVQGEELLTDGLNVQLNYNNGATSIIDGSNSLLSYTYNFSAVGTRTVTVKYGVYTDTFDCEISSYDDYLETLTKVIVATTSACPGQTFTVDIKLENNVGILAAALTVNCDPMLTLVDAQAGDALSSLTLTKPGSYTSSSTFAWDGINNADASNGTLLTLTFVLSEDAVKGESYGISVSYESGNVINGDFDNVELNTVSGSVTAIDYISGDLNGDGTINMADVVNLRRYIVGGYDLNINLEAADVDNNGTINMADVVLIRRYVVGGYDVVLK